MIVPQNRIPAILLVCLTASVGCIGSNNAEVTKEKARADAAEAELAKANARADTAERELARLTATQAQPKAVDADRRAAEWVLRVDGAVRVSVDEVTHEVKKGGKLPDGKTMKLIGIALTNCPKATDDGVDYIRGLNDLQGFGIDHNTPIRKFDFLADMTNLETLTFESSHAGVSDKDLVHIKGLSKLKRLWLYCHFGNPNITDVGLENVKDLKQLERLSLFNCNITDAGLQKLTELGELRELSLEFTKITDAGLDNLKLLTKLEALGVRETKVTDAGVKSLQAALPACKITR